MGAATLADPSVPLPTAAPFWMRGDGPGQSRGGAGGQLWLGKAEEGRELRGGWLECGSRPQRLEQQLCHWAWQRSPSCSGRAAPHPHPSGAPLCHPRTVSNEPSGDWQLGQSVTHGPEELRARGGSESLPEVLTSHLLTAVAKGSASPSGTESSLSRKKSKLY